MFLLDNVKSFKADPPPAGGIQILATAQRSADGTRHRPSTQ